MRAQHLPLVTAGAKILPSASFGNPDTAKSELGFPFVIFCLYTFVLIGRPQDYVPALGPLRLGVVFTVISALVTIFRTSGDNEGIFRHTETQLYFFLYAVMCAGIPFSIYPRASFNFVILAYAANMAFYAMFLVHVNTLAKFSWIICVLVFCALIFSLVGLVQGHFESGRFVTGSSMFDPNDTAFVEVSLLAFGVCVLLGSFRKQAKAVALASVLVSVLLTLYTGSRGGFLGLAAFLVLFLVLRVPTVKRSHKAMLLAFVVLVAALNVDKLNFDRYATLTDLGNDYNISEEDGRTQVWKRGFQLLLDHPLTGVGVDGFPDAIGTMRDEENLIPLWQAPHNAYVQVITETGIIGGGAFLFLVFTCLKTFNRLRSRPGPRSVDSQTDLSCFAGILLIGFIAGLISAFFLSQGYSIPFTLFFAASASLKGIAAKADKENDDSGRLQDIVYHSGPTGLAGRKLIGSFSK
jgi:O-antigen ligase